MLISYIKYFLVLLSLDEMWTGLNKETGCTVVCKFIPKKDDEISKIENKPGFQGYTKCQDLYKYPVYYGKIDE